jgi:hypothetical protein
MKERPVDERDNEHLALRFKDQRNYDMQRTRLDIKITRSECGRGCIGLA